MTRHVYLALTLGVLGCGPPGNLAPHRAEIIRRAGVGNGPLVNVVVRDTGLREPHCTALLGYYRPKALPAGAVMVMAAADSAVLCSEQLGDSSAIYVAAAVADPVAARCQAIRAQELAHRISAWRIEEEEARWRDLLEAGELNAEALRDSLRATPPPRPSETNWYQEHCWEGRPR